MATTIVLILIATASVLFHLLTGARSTTSHVTSADGLPLLRDLPGILIGAGFDHHQNSTILDACFVEADALLRDAPVAERSNEPGCDARGSGARQRGGNRAGHDKAKGGQRQSGAHSGEDRDQDFDPTTRRASKLTALRIPLRQLRRGPAAIMEESFARFLGHDDVHIARLIAALDAGLVGALSALAVAEQTRDPAVANG